MKARLARELGVDLSAVTRDHLEIQWEECPAGLTGLMRWTGEGAPGVTRRP